MKTTIAEDIVTPVKQNAFTARRHIMNKPAQGRGEDFEKNRNVESVP